ncbi:hypothetical protein V1292_004277 [Bradyrhizobium sp. AZCC 1719]|uniref:hypothetical protein n=1 Tax=Bradyrhizobium sp. AZCC 1719 TaxID=3117028 RepID=UPI00302BB417
MAGEGHAQPKGEPAMADDIARGKALTNAGDLARGAMTISTARSASAWRATVRYYPAFPYPNFTKLTRQDILVIHAYLATTLAPVTNAPRAPGVALAVQLPLRRSPTRRTMSAMPGAMQRRW